MDRDNANVVHIPGDCSLEAVEEGRTCSEMDQESLQLLVAEAVEAMVRTSSLALGESCRLIPEEAEREALMHFEAADDVEM